MARRLTLRREALAALSTEELGHVVGGNLTPWIETFPVDDCLLAPRTGYSVPDCTVPTNGTACATLTC